MKIAILGAGSAGILTTGCILKDFKNRGIDCEVTHIYDTNKPILGVGESTTSEVTFAIGQAFDFIFATEAKELNSTTKYGTQYIDWREKEIIFPFQSGYHAIHFDARDFAEMGLNRLQKMYSNYRRVDANVEYKDLTEYDYVIDCRGRPTDFSDYEECNLVLNSALVYDDPTPSDFGFTKHVAHKYGWMFVIPLQHRTSHGFLYNNEFCTRKEAENELIRITEASDDDRSNFRTFDLKPYYCKKTIDGKILKSGNRAVFFEPMSANSLYMTVKNAEIHSQYIRGEITQDKANELCILNYRAVEDLINLIYHGGSIYENEFWDWAKETSSKRIEQTNVLKRYVANQDDEMFKTITERFMGHHVLRYVDKEFEFGYFDD
jgi:tryptophan halogenase|tara:strand:+ start:2154 stop:3284 length:1131 start_codon:yes stop_codon:yes gene_type:complete